ncbi:DoxX family protein [Aureibaculum sp. A20]|uniref:DoxX family protein n=1 Tax=Aureibaculum flavum TaxID=2795986 RepID=A0ABS0WR00_9FLAO|nr:DoxX family protein [Aureibaculum flavum]MBJ2174402.1 DoxX family protein [Aureibaculum flavum]
MLLIAIILSSSAFFFYGINCLYSPKIAAEFIRFGMNKTIRLLTGYLQLIGAIGLVVGYFCLPDLVFIASAGLTLLMLLGFAVRIKIKDSILESSPSLIFAALNLYICVAYYSKLTLL